MEVNNKMKHTIKVAWAKGFSQFLALAGAILLVFVLFKFDAIMAQIVRIINILMPIIMGIVLAYLINPMVEFYDRKLQSAWQSHRKEVWKETFYERGVNTYKSGHNNSHYCSANHDGGATACKQYHKCGQSFTGSDTGPCEKSRSLPKTMTGQRK